MRFSNQQSHSFVQIYLCFSAKSAVLDSVHCIVRSHILNERQVLLVTFAGFRERGSDPRFKEGLGLRAIGAILDTREMQVQTKMTTKFIETTTFTTLTTQTTLKTTFSNSKRFSAKKNRWNKEELDPKTEPENYLFLCPSSFNLLSIASLTFSETFSISTLAFRPRSIRASASSASKMSRRLVCWCSIRS